MLFRTLSRQGVQQGGLPTCQFYTHKKTCRRAGWGRPAAHAGANTELVHAEGCGGGRTHPVSAPPRAHRSPPTPALPFSTPTLVWRGHARVGLHDRASRCPARCSMCSHALALRRGTHTGASLSARRAGVLRRPSYCEGRGVSAQHALHRHSATCACSLHAPMLLLLLMVWPAVTPASPGHRHHQLFTTAPPRPRS